MSAAVNATGDILNVDHLSMRFGGIVAIKELSFAAQRRKITALIGPNGAGKTTVFNCITGFYRPSSGAIRLTHDDGARFSLETLRDFRISKIAKVARTFQNIRLFPGMTALENLMVAQHAMLMRASGFTSGRTSGYRPSPFLAGSGAPVGPRRRCRRHPRLRRSATSRNRAGDVHATGPALSR
jgi:ABC-type branched-subunit amino acid transport system ATPase component